MRRILGLATLALLVFASACSQSEPDDTAQDVTPKDGPTITIGSAEFTESIVLAEIYAQGLEAKGYTTDTKLRIGEREAYFPALERGDIDFFPDYTGSLLHYLTKQKETASPDSDETFEAVKRVIEGKEITLLDYAPAQDKDAIVTNKQTAEKYDLEKISDLAPHAKKLVMGGPSVCPERQACLKGLEDVYGLKFKKFESLDVAGPLTIAALEGNTIQVANLFTTQSVIVEKGFLILEDDKGPIAGAENVVPAVRDETLDAYDEDLVAAVDAITQTITTERLLELNSRVDNDKEDAADVAADFLVEENLA